MDKAKLERLTKQYLDKVPHIPLDDRELMDKSAPNKSTRIVNGDSSNVVNWDDTRFPWAFGLYKKMLGNFWTPFEINMHQDIKDFPKMNEEEQDTFLKIIGLLAFLDSVQTDYSSQIADQLTDSSINALMVLLAQQEVIHNHSYSYILSSLVEKNRQDEVFEYWKHDPVLIERNDFLINGYKPFVEDKTVANLFISIIYDVMLEGLFFYSGFAFFYDLARSGRMVATSTMINYINRDEQQHVRLFKETFAAVKLDFPEFDIPELYELGEEIIRQAAQYEMSWSQYVIGHKFDTINVDELSGYIRFMANVRAKQLRIPAPFDKQDTNPMSWIKVYEDTDLGKTDFFEQKSRQYVKTDDEFDDTEDLELDL